MSRNRRDYLHTMYFIGGIMILVLAVVALVSFYKAVTYDEPKPTQSRGFSDSIQVKQLKKEISVLTYRVDSLEAILQQKPKVKYRYLKNKRDSSVIELHIHNEKE